MSDLIILICSGSSIVGIYELYRYLDDHRRESCVGSQKEELKILSQNISKPCKFDVIKLTINGYICGQKGGA